VDAPKRAEMKMGRRAVGNGGGGKGLGKGKKKNCLFPPLERRSDHVPQDTVAQKLHPSVLRSAGLLRDRLLDGKYSAVKRGGG